MKHTLIVFVLVISTFASQRAVSGPNQGMTIYCSGTGCTAWGSVVLDLSNSTNWTLMLRIRFDPALNYGFTRDLFSQSTLVGGTFTCAGMYLRQPGTGSAAPIDVKITITGGISSTTLFSGSINMNHGPWYSYVLTHDSSHNWHSYVNGSSDGSTNATPTMDTGCNTFVATVSGATDCGGGETGCWINDVALFSSVIPTNDITAFASGTRPNLLSVQPIAWWPMEGGYPNPCTLAAGFPEADASGHVHTIKLGFDPSPDYCGATGAQTNGNVMQPDGEATH